MMEGVDEMYSDVKVPPILSQCPDASGVNTVYVRESEEKLAPDRYLRTAHCALHDNLERY